jgi:hypothetical protein
VALGPDVVEKKNSVWRYEISHVTQVGGRDFP